MAQPASSIEEMIIRENIVINTRFIFITISSFISRIIRYLLLVMK